MGKDINHVEVGSGYGLPIARLFTVVGTIQLASEVVRFFNNDNRLGPPKAWLSCY